MADGEIMILEHRRLTRFQAAAAEAAERALLAESQTALTEALQKIERAKKLVSEAIANPAKRDELIADMVRELTPARDHLDEILAEIRR